MSSTLGLYNPLRYRGYVYDRESGLYYLQSRYYNPEWGRFLNHDVVFDYDVGVQGYNLFTYCGNNPINRIDISGADSREIDADEENADDEVPKGGLLGGAGQGNGNPVSSGSTTIYRYGYAETGPKKLVPTQNDLQSADKSGLSFSTKLKPGAAMTTIEAVNATGVLYAVQDGAHHVSVYPIGATLAEWYAAGYTSKWTQALVDIVQISPEMEILQK